MKQVIGLLLRNKFFRKHKLAKAVGGLVAVLALGMVEHYIGGDNSTSTYTIKDKKVAYTRHARCRMKCRDITSQEVQDVLMNGQKNNRKSDPQAKPCPAISMEKTTKDGQHVRVVIGDCPKKYSVISVIDLKRSHNCNCR